MTRVTSGLLVPDLAPEAGVEVATADAKNFGLDGLSIVQGVLNLVYSSVRSYILESSGPGLESGLLYIFSYALLFQTKFL